jgi:2-polyprenyl-6-methoxyphenol hydroxylase-like FAD-dependent oxidoreductase
MTHTDAMSQRRRNLPSAQQELDAAFYDQRAIIKDDANQRDESKRRKMIRWFRDRFSNNNSHGNSHQQHRRDPSPSLPARSTHHSTSRSNHSRGSPAKSGRQYDTSSTMSTSDAYYSESMPDMSSLTISRQPAVHHDPRAHVLIVGGGVGGLCLAQGLKKAGIPFTIFERDPSPNYRSQGYRVRIDSMGYEALKANLSPSSFEVFLRATGHFLPGVQYVDAQSGGRAAPELEQYHKKVMAGREHRHMFSADRAMMRSLMLSDLDDREVQFGMRYKRHDTLPNGRVQVAFENGRVVEGSVLVGADGTTSRVRRHYVPHCATLLDTDAGAIYGKTPRTPELDALFSPDSSTIVLCRDPPMSLVVEPRGRKTSDSIDLEKSIASSHSSDHLDDLDELTEEYICWVLVTRARHFNYNGMLSVRELYSMEPQRVAQLSCAMTRHWSPKVRLLLQYQAPEWCSFLRISTMAPELHSWAPSQVTLLGDALHTMVPAGFGCNTALYDAQVLVKLFQERGVNVDAIARYEREMRAAGKDAIKLSLAAGSMMFGLPHVRDMHVVAS